MTTDRWPPAVTVALGCGLLLARPLLWSVPGLPPVAVLVLTFGALGLVGAFWPLAPGGHTRGSGGAGVLLVGVGAFAVARLVGGGEPVATATARVVVLSSLAAVAEEAFFRRLVFAALARHGEAVAVVGSAAVFAVCHVTVYGSWVLPIDLAAGMLLGWQRAASGGWRVPAVTHVVANVLAVS